jgi:hypothetical protein
VVPFELRKSGQRGRWVLEGAPRVGRRRWRWASKVKVGRGGVRSWVVVAMLVAILDEVEDGC